MVPTWNLSVDNLRKCCIEGSAGYIHVEMLLKIFSEGSRVSSKIVIFGVHRWVCVVGDVSRLYDGLDRHPKMASMYCDINSSGCDSYPARCESYGHHRMSTALPASDCGLAREAMPEFVAKLPVRRVIPQVATSCRYRPSTCWLLSHLWSGEPPDPSGFAKWHVDMNCVFLLN